MSEGFINTQNRHDLLSSLRESFSMPKDKIYLNGNSLGPLQTKVQQRLEEVLSVEWGEDLITSWKFGNLFAILRVPWPWRFLRIFNVFFRRSMVCAVQSRANNEISQNFHNIQK